MNALPSLTLPAFDLATSLRHLDFRNKLKIGRKNPYLWTRLHFKTPAESKYTREF